MKSLSNLLFGLFCAGVSLAPGQEDDIPLGIEAVAGFRSDYVYRGFDLAQTTMDFQVETELVISDALSLGAGGWVATQLDDGFNERTGFIDLYANVLDGVTIGASGVYRAYDHDILKSGFDLTASLIWHPASDWSIAAEVSRDFPSAGWYGELSGQWSRRLSDDAYLGMAMGISATDDYYGHSGLNDFNGRISLTYNINSMVSVTPFAGWSHELTTRDGDELYGGLWFEISF